MRYFIIVGLFVLIIHTMSIRLYAQDEDGIDEAYATALARIQDAQERDAIMLDLRSLSLTAVPPEIGNLINLQILLLSDNALTTVPPEIGNLINLEELYLRNNQLGVLPPE